MRDEGQELKDVGGQVNGGHVREGLDGDEECGGDDVAEYEDGFPAVHVAGAPSVLKVESREMKVIILKVGTSPVSLKNGQIFGPLAKSYPIAKTSNPGLV